MSARRPVRARPIYRTLYTRRGRQTSRYTVLIEAARNRCRAGLPTLSAAKAWAAEHANGDHFAIFREHPLGDAASTLLTVVGSTCGTAGLWRFDGMSARS